MPVSEERQQFKDALKRHGLPETLTEQDISRLCCVAEGWSLNRLEEAMRVNRHNIFTWANAVGHKLGLENVTIDGIRDWAMPRNDELNTMLLCEPDDCTVCEREKERKS